MNIEAGKHDMRMSDMVHMELCVEIMEKEAAEMAYRFAGKMACRCAYAMIVAML